jgi:hypothetical protein
MKSGERLGATLCVAAALTKTLYLDHLANGREPEDSRLLSDQSVDIAVIEFRDRTALSTDQELPRMRAARVAAADERIQGIKAMYQICLDQEFQRPIDGRRRSPSPLPIETVKNFVGTRWLVTVPDQLQYTTPEPGQTQATSPAHDLRSFDRSLDAVVVIVVRGREVDCSRCTVHDGKLN